MNKQFRITKLMNGNSELLLTDDDPSVIFLFINQILSNEINITTLHNCQHGLIQWKVGDCDYILESIHDKLCDEYLVYLPFLLFSEKTLNNTCEEYLQKIIELDPKYLCDIFVQKCMTDPYMLLIDIFKIKEELIYQVFVHYLNKTIDVSNGINKIDLMAVVKMFFVNGEFNMDKYSKLFLKYLKMKPLMPFMIVHKKYEVIFNI